MTHSPTPPLNPSSQFKHSPHDAKNPFGASNPYGNAVTLVPCDCHSVGSVVQLSLLSILNLLPEDMILPPDV
jgi:hypothetical protein